MGDWPIICETILVDLEAIDGATLCHCGSCDYNRVAACDLLTIGDCVLTPGDPVPAGRCPMCDCLVYPLPRAGKPE